MGKDHLLTQLSLHSIALDTLLDPHIGPLLQFPPLGPVRTTGQHHLQKGETSGGENCTQFSPVLLNIIYLESVFKEGQERDLLTRKKTRS